MPSKALLHAAAVGLDDPFQYAREKRDELNQRETREMADHDTVELIRGHGRLTARTDPHAVEVTAEDGSISQVRAEHVIVSAGSQPVEFAIDGLAPERVHTNESIFELTEIPSKIVLIGGGSISLEMATAFRDLGSDVDIVEVEDRLMVNGDPRASEAIQASLEGRGVMIHTGTSIERFDGATAHLGDGSVTATSWALNSPTRSSPTCPPRSRSDVPVCHSSRSPVSGSTSHRRSPTSSTRSA